MFESSAQNRLINTHACPCIVATRTSLFECFRKWLRVHAIIFQKITCMFSHAIIYWMVHIAFFLRVHAKIVSPVTRAHAYQVIVILACTRTVYPAFTCVFSKIMFDWVHKEVWLLVEMVKEINQTNWIFPWVYHSIDTVISMSSITEIIEYKNSISNSMVKLVKRNGTLQTEKYDIVPFIIF